MPPSCTGKRYQNTSGCHRTHSVTTATAAASCQTVSQQVPAGACSCCRARCTAVQPAQRLAASRVSPARAPTGHGVVMALMQTRPAAAREDAHAYGPWHPWPHAHARAVRVQLVSKNLKRWRSFLESIFLFPLSSLSRSLNLHFARGDKACMIKCHCQRGWPRRGLRSCSKNRWGTMPWCTPSALYYYKTRSTRAAQGVLLGALH